jgi:hypothetical protein
MSAHVPGLKKAEQKNRKSISFVNVLSFVQKTKPNQSQCSASTRIRAPKNMLFLSFSSAVIKETNQ